VVVKNFRKPQLTATIISKISRDKRSINEGKELSAELDENSIEKLDLEYSKYLEKTSAGKKLQVSIHAEAYECNFMQGIRPWSQLIRTKNSTFMSVVSVNEFFKDNPDKPYSALRSHSLEQSPCYPIGAKPARGFHSTSELHYYDRVFGEGCLGIMSVYIRCWCLSSSTLH
jgi:hypothetical protein